MSETPKLSLTMHLTCNACRTAFPIMEGGYLRPGTQLLGNSQVRATCAHCGEEAEYPIRQIVTT